MTKRAIVTIVTRNYLAYARALMNQCAQHEPDVDRVVILADRPPTGEAADAGPARIVFAEDLGVDRWPRFAFQYTPFELACALKPHAVDYLIRRMGYDAIVYLDGDMGLFGPLTPVWHALKGDAIVLTPHLLQPLPEDGLRPHESVFLYCGEYNAGMFGVQNSATGRSFLNWWKSMHKRHCIVDLAAGLFVDQKWLSLVPGLFGEVCILRHFGINAGHWTLSQAAFTNRPTTGTSTSNVFCGNDPLVLFHFSGMTPHKPREYLNNQNRTTLEAIPPLQRIVEQFHRDVRAAGLAVCESWGCAFDRLTDGTPIHPAWREAVRRDEAVMTRIEDPFDAVTQPHLLGLYRGFEPHAHKWRRDWRLSWQKTRGVAGTVRSALGHFRNITRSLRPQRRHAA